MLTSNSSNVIMRNASTTSWCAITLRTVMTVVMRGMLSAKWLVCIVLSYLILIFLFCSILERTQQSGICDKAGHYFSCMGAPCLPLYRVCDTTNDCIYGTDESINVCGRVRYAKSGETVLTKTTLI